MTVAQEGDEQEQEQRHGLGLASNTSNDDGNSFASCTSVECDDGDEQLAATTAANQQGQLSSVAATDDGEAAGDSINSSKTKETKSQTTPTTEPDKVNVNVNTNKLNAIQVGKHAGKQPRAKLARKERAQMLEARTQREATVPSKLKRTWREKENRRQGRHSGTIRRDDGPTKPEMTWREKENERQGKHGSTISRGDGPTAIYGREEVLPGSFAITTSTNQAPHQADSTTRSNIHSDEEVAGDRDQVLMHNPSQNQLPSSTTGLVHATLVDPVFAEADIIDLDFLEEERDMRQNDRIAKMRQRRRSRLLLVSVNLLAGLLALVLLLYFFVFRDNSDSEEYLPSPSATTAVPTMSPAPTVFNPFQLPTATWEAIEADPESPQAQAHEWLLDDNAFFEMSGHASNDATDSNSSDTSGFSSGNNSGISSSKSISTSKNITATIDHMSEWRIHQRYALAVLYYATTNTSTGWTEDSGWLEHGEHECSWFASDSSDGVTYPCQEEPGGDPNPGGRYMTLRLRHNGLHGRLAPEIFSLMPSLQTIDLIENHLSGIIETEIGILAQQLESLELSLNRMTGTLPLQLFDLTMLTSLELADNGFGGSLSARLGALTKLTTLRMENNRRLSGSLQTELGLLTLLETLEFQDNRLIGKIPSSIGLLTKLTKLHTHNNQLTGSIPSQVGNMMELLLLRMHNNSLTGAIPSELGVLRNIESIILEKNNLTQSIPSELGVLSKLEKLRLNDNRLSGFLPSWLGNIMTLEILSAQSNSLVGTIPPELAKPTALERLLLYGNALTGTLPLGFFEYPLPKFERLILHENLLVGTIPSTVGVLSSMTHCSLHTNALNGTIPTELGLLPSLVGFAVGFTSLSGSLPSELGSLSRLEELNISSTNLTGSIPSQLAALPNLGVFDLSNTDMTGVLPDEFCSLGEYQIIFNCTSSLCGCNCTCPPPQGQGPEDSTSMGNTTDHWPHEEEIQPNNSFSAQNATSDAYREEEVTGGPSSASPNSPNTQFIPPAPESLAATCSFRGLATPVGFARCEDACEQALCCGWKNDTSCSSQLECASYSQHCVNLNAGPAIQGQVEAACADGMEDETDCLILCAAAGASCCFASDIQDTCAVANPGIICREYQACDVIYN